MPNIFTYGSLMFNQVWSRIVSAPYEATAATLSNYARLDVLEEEYPAAVPLLGASIAGVLYRDISGADIVKLDTFEGEYYIRQPVNVVTSKGEDVAADVYIFSPEFMHLVAHTPWSVEKFINQGGIERFLARYKGFMT